jgi:hypothetical protein
MVYRTLCPWYFDPLSMIFCPAIHGILTPHPWHIEHSTHGIMTYYPWYYGPPAYLWIINEGGQNTMEDQFTTQVRISFQ